MPAPSRAKFDKMAENYVIGPWVI